MKDMYFHLVIHPSHRKVLHFMVGQEHLQFQVLLFGLAMAPRVFTNIFSVIADKMR